MTIVDRSGPGVRITLLDNERAPSGEPLDLAGRIIAFTYEDAEKKADQVSLQLDNFDLALFDRDELVGGATLEVSWGYPGNMAPPRRVIVKKLKGFQTLTVEGQATSVLMNREAKTRSWANKSRADVEQRDADARPAAVDDGHASNLRRCVLRMTSVNTRRLGTKRRRPTSSSRVGSTMGSGWKSASTHQKPHARGSAAKYLPARSKSVSP